MIIILLYFIIAQIIGLYTGHYLLSDSASKVYIDQFALAPFEADSLANVIVFLFFVVLGAVMMLFLVKKKKTNLLIYLEFFSIVFGASIAIYSFINPFINQFYISAAISGAIALAIYLLKYTKYRFEAGNLNAILASAGVGAILGYSISYVPMGLFVIGLAIYDYIAVFKTKHMQKIATSIDVDKLSLIIRSKKGKLKKTKTKGEGIALGTGDIVVPIAFAVSLTRINLLVAIFAEIGAILGLIYLLNKVRKEKSFLPALPYIVPPMIISAVILFFIAK